MTVYDDGTYPDDNSQAFQTQVTIAGAPAPTTAPTKKVTCFASSETVQLCLFRSYYISGYPTYRYIRPIAAQQHAYM